MKKHLFMCFLFVLLLVGCGNRPDKAEVEQIVHEYIVNNPAVLAESIQNLQKQIANKKKINNGK